MYTHEGIAAAFLAFLPGPEMAGGVMGFFVGLGSALFEDLTIFLHIGEMWDAIKQIPALIGQIINNPAILLDMVRGMVEAVLAKANLMNPLGPSLMTAVQMGDALVKYFWHLFDASIQLPKLDRQDLFTLAFAVSHSIGNIVEQFVLGVGMARVQGSSRTFLSRLPFPFPPPTRSRVPG